MLSSLKVGTELSSSIWNSFGAIIVLVIMGSIAYKFFLGQQRNIIAGIGAIVGAALIITLGLTTDAFTGIGNTLLGLVTN